MSILIFVEGSDGELKKISKEAVSYGFALGQMMDEQEVIAVVLGEYEQSALEELGTCGASKVLNVSDPSLNESDINPYSDVLSEVLSSTGASIVIMGKTSFGDNVAGRIAGIKGGSIATNVTSLPDVASGFAVKKSIFTGKAFATVNLTGELKILTVKKNTVEIKADHATASVQKIENPVSAAYSTKITGSDKAEGDILLDDAEVVVSGGRGLKGPENWGMVEELAQALGAATGCSKPVSDLGWRPHHEHVGQTGVKVSPNLYIAVGISGAIQHLAGVNSSKVLVAINKDPDAPFFKAADYGIIGDAFEIIPRLTEKVKSL